MSVKRVAVIFDNTARPETTGVYCRRALGQLVEVEHFLPTELSTIPRDFDLYLNIDDGLTYRLPDDLRPSAWWAIDTHLDFQRCLTKARDADFVFAAQRNGTQRLRDEGITSAQWLPLACDPDLHGQQQTDKKYDVAFVGNFVSGPRLELLQLIQSRFPNHWLGQCYFMDMATVYSAARIAFNRSIADDVNMRVFEALASGTLLLTNDLRDNGLEDLFQNDVHLATYVTAAELLEKIALYLGNPAERERIAAAGRNEVLAKHTYLHRMQTILDRTTSRSSSANSPKSGARPSKDRHYFQFARPEVLSLVPESARHVLDIGCGGGRLGKCVKERQAAEVVGLELNPTAAEEARLYLDDVLLDNIETGSIDFPKGRFDCVVCADVLEHLRDPLAALQKIRSWLSSSGRLVASIPNVRHHSVVTSLLEGRWEYQSAGLLDNDHVRFFTLREIEKLLFRAGFAIEQLQFVPGDGFEEWKARGRPDELNAGKLHLAGLAPGEAEQFHAYQYLLTAIPQDHADHGLTSMVIVTFNELSYTRQCLQSIRRRTDEAIEIIVVDNGSTDGTVEFLRTQPDIRLVVNPENLGYPAAVNQGIKIALGRQILLLNNDVIVTTGWLRYMLDALYSDSTVGMVGPYTNSTAGSQRIVGTSELRQLDDFAWRRGFPQRKQRMEVAELTGFCLLIRREVIERLGMFDERFGVGVYEDIDYCRRASLAGFRLMIAEEVFIHHFGHRSFHGNGIDQDALAVQNEQVFADKWNNSTSTVEYTAEAQKIAGQISQFADEHRRNGDNLGANPAKLVESLYPTLAKKCLMIGRDAAKLAVEMRRLNPTSHLTVWLFAPDPAQSSVFDEIYTGEPDAKIFELWGASFDVAVCGPLCEIREPVPFLRRIRGLLKPEGALLATLPNTRHHHVVTALLEGSWSEAPVDHYDDEVPLRFFTRQEIEKLFYRAGLEITELRPVPGQGHERWLKNGKPGQVSLGSLSITGLSSDEAEDFFIGRYAIRAAPAPEADFGLTSIIIVTHNQLVHTCRCVDSIVLHAEEPYELIFIDNGSSDGTPQYLQSRESATVILNKENRGFPAAVNQGLKVARGQNILLLNNDCIVTTGWLRRLLTALHSQREIGLVGPVSNNVSGLQQVPVRYSDIAGLDGFAWEYGKQHHGETEQVNRLVGFCLLIKRDVVQRIGLMDERFGIGCFEDDDYVYRALAAGFQAVIARDAFIHHVGSATFRASGLDFTGLMKHNEVLYRKKWKSSDTAASDLTTESNAIAPSYTPARRPSGGVILRRAPIRLSLCMIVRNNETTIGPCLQSIFPWVDELIVVDTGSTDRTPFIAEEFGARVFHFPWCDDFSAARNESLRHARGEWLFWMDSDDTISPENGRRLRDLSRATHERSTMGFVMQVHCPGGGEGDDHDVTVVDHIKMLRNRPDLRFEGRIHEQILPSIRCVGGEVAWSDIFVVHSGSDRSQDGQKRKLERDYKLLELDLMERPGHPFVLFNIGMTHNDAGKHAEAVVALSRCLEVSHFSESHVRKAHALLIASLSQLNRYDDAWVACMCGRELYPDDMELLFREAMLHHHFGRLTDAERSYLAVLRPTGERYFASYDRGLCSFKARHNLAIVYEDMLKPDLALEQWQKILQDLPSYLPARHAVGRILFQLDSPNAELALRELVKLEPKGAATHHNLGMFYLRLGRYADAIPPLRRAVELRPDDVEARIHLGQAFRSLGRFAETAEIWSQAAALAPDRDDLRELLSGMDVSSMARNLG